MNIYRRQPVALVSGHGVWVTDSHGRELIDMVAGIAVNVLGHCHPAVRAALDEQASTLIHTSGLFYTKPQIDAAELLVSQAFPGSVFFCNSGAEAVEAALKLARKWGKRHREDSYKVVCFQGAFHGRTLGALSATSGVKYREPFEPLPEGFVRVPYNDADAVAAAITDDVAAVLLEPILGESGVYVMDDSVLRDIRRICDERHVLLILDETQTGMGRTGTWWAHQHAGVRPDVMAVAKGLGGGVPIGAVIAAPRADVFEPGDHGSTFGGNPLACAVAVAVMQTIAEENLCERATASGERLRRGLLELSEGGAPIEEIRGRGLMIGVGLSEDLAQRVARAGLVTGILVNAVGERTLRLIPPLILTEDEADEAIRRLAEAIELAHSERGA
jgi:predicted acetylornithine/succinylornithine family transaminase